MADRFETPIDELSGLPLPLYTPPIDELAAERIRTNRHHHMHPANELRAGLGSQAVRHVRVQETDIAVHRLYHANFDGPPLPETQRERYDFVVLAAAGVIPRHAIAFDDDDEPYVVELTADERQDLWRTDTVHGEAPDVIRAFLLEYTLRHGRHAISGGMIDEFLHTTDQARRLELGRQLLLIAAEVTTEPLRERYDLARAEQLMTPVRSRQVGQFVCNLLTLGPYGIVRRKAINQLAPHLTAFQP